MSRGPHAPEPLRLASAVPRLPARGGRRVLGRLGAEVHRRHLPRLRDTVSHRVSRLHRASGARARDPTPGRLTRPPHRSQLSLLAPRDERFKAGATVTRTLGSFLQNTAILATPPCAGYALGARTRAYLARVAKLADAPDLGSGGCKSPWGFDSPLSHQFGASMTLVCVVRSLRWRSRSSRPASG